MKTKKTPPFVIFIHQSARALSKVINTEYTPYTTRWYLWLPKNGPMIPELKSSLISYFTRAKKLSYALPYLKDEIKKHEEMAIE